MSSPLHSYHLSSCFLKKILSIRFILSISSAGTTGNYFGRDQRDVQDGCTGWVCSESSCQ
jgi:hypothetical protein